MIAETCPRCGLLVSSVLGCARYDGPDGCGWLAARESTAYRRGIDEGVRLAKEHARMDVCVIDDGDGYTDDLSDIDWTDVDAAAAKAKGGAT